MGNLGLKFFFFSKAGHSKRQFLYTFRVSIFKFMPKFSTTNQQFLQVHNRIEYLRHLIASLRIAKDIDKVLLIFSHDIYNTSINELVRGIDYCMVMQIFFPYSIQLYPNEFPGTDPRDCERDVGRAVAMRTGCLNARNDDTYGHYREAKFTQMKV